MYRLRFHGRGGHGMKTASRIVGAAAFIEGYYVQDSPLYGAERRGAPITAYTRISSAPILERGIIANPDIVVIADDSLVEDPLVNPRRGTSDSTVFIINTGTPDPERKYLHMKRMYAIDATEISLAMIGKGAALSATLGGAACRVLGFISEKNMAHAVQKELEAIGLSEDIIEKNVAAASKCFNSLKSVEMLNRESAEVSSEGIVTIPYHDPTISSPSVYSSANISERQTGEWRIFKPVINYDKCTKCWVCFVWCPDGAISLDDAEYPHIDYDHCKGCLICHEECPPKAISIEREVKAW